MMAKLGILLILCSSAELALGQWQWNFLWSRAGGKCDEGQKSGTFCKDSNTIVRCDGNGNVMGTRQCSDPTKYCWKGSCTSIDLWNPTFDCPQPGFFIHPLSCYHFLYCKEPAGTTKNEGEATENKPEKAVAYKCENKTRFDPVKRVCTNRNIPCVQYNPLSSTGKCNGAPDWETLMVGDGSTYIMCNEGKLPSIHACKAPQKFSQDKHACVFKCPEEGFYPHEDETKYYQCVSNDKNVLEFIEASCGENQKFDAKTNFCILSESPEGPPAEP